MTLVALPRKGKLSQSAQAIEQSADTRQRGVAFNLLQDDRSNTITGWQHRMYDRNVHHVGDPVSRYF